MELLFRRTDFHPPLPCQKGIKYSLKAEYSYIVTSDLSHVPVGFKGICHRRSSERDAARKSADIYILFFFYQGAGTCVYRAYQNSWTCSCLGSVPPYKLSLRHYPNLYLGIQRSDKKSVEYNTVVQCLCALRCCLHARVSAWEWVRMTSIEGYAATKVMLNCCKDRCLKWQ